MLRSLRAIFQQQIASFAETPESAHALEIASAALLMEISRADHDESSVEKESIRGSIKQVFHLSEGEIEDIMSTAEQAVDEAVSLYDFTSIVNERFSREQKVELIAKLWAVAYADNELDRYEEYYVRKIADLLHISHSDYIKTKLRAMPS
ncbi:MAG: putative tellurite resistance protein B-like protein [Gammaproteobacteria bacterium]|jgi:uncharacterized tellurite resistance protein B-like protein